MGLAKHPGMAWRGFSWLAVCLVLAGCDRAAELRERPHTHPGVSAGVGTVGPRSLESLPSDERGALIRLGYRLVTQTQDTARAYVGNGLNCTNCHLDGGRKIGAAPFVGLSRIYPEYRSRNGRLNTIEDRLDDCFARSMNGTPLPAGSREKVALVAYIDWLSEGITREEALGMRGIPRIAAGGTPNANKGAGIYDMRCSGCHGAEGGGTSMAPPVWGPRSYNIGAGMARVSVAAAFIKHQMPLGQGGSLTDEEAYDLAAYINRRPRPDFPDKRFDWPKGDKPEDVPY